MSQVNFDKIRNRFNKAREDRARRGKIYYIKMGLNRFRLMVLPKGKDVPFAEAGKHFNLDLIGSERKQAYCPKLSRGQDCPICDLVETMYNSESDEDRNIAGRISSSMVYLFNVIVRDREDIGPKIIEVGENTWMDILDLFGVEEGDEQIDLTHPVRGHDITITRRPKSQYGTSYTTKAVTKSSPIGTKKQLKQWLEDQTDLDEYIDSQMGGAAQIAQGIWGDEGPSSEEGSDEEPAEEEVELPEDEEEEPEESETSEDDDNGMDGLPESEDDLPEDEEEEPEETVPEDLPEEEPGEDDFEVKDGKVTKKEKPKPKAQKPKASSKEKSKPKTSSKGKPKKDASQIAAEIKERIAATKAAASK